MQLIPRLDPPERPLPPRRRLRTVSTLPTLMTLGNLICGLAAIHFCLRAMYDAGAMSDPSVELTLSSRILERLLPSFLSIGAVFIFIGLVLDGLDGSVARLTQRTSDFGGQLDSLADMVTFGAAPAMLVIAVLMTQPEVGVPGPLSGDLAGRATWMMIAIYVACAAMRLARFNVENTRRAPAHRRFAGLPSPGAATVLASLVLLHQHILLHQRFNEAVAPYLAFALPFVAVALGLLMVSRVGYLHLANLYLRGRLPFGQVVAMIFLLAVLAWYKEATLAVLVCAYAASGPIAAVIRFVRHRPPEPSPEETADDDAGQPPADTDQRTA